MTGRSWHSALVRDVVGPPIPLGTIPATTQRLCHYPGPFIDNLHDYDNDTTTIVEPHY